MKTILAILAVAFVFAGTSSLWADDGRHGYRDDHHRYHSYVYWHDHRGYWDHRGAVRIFINCG